MHWNDWTQPEAVKAVIAIVTLLLAVYGFFHGLRAYREQKTRENDELERRNDETERQGRLNRFEKFQQMHSRYQEDSSIQVVLRSLYPEQIEGDKEKQSPATLEDKLNFMGFYEELAIMVNSGLLRPETAYYTFGVDSGKFWEKETYWHDDPTWKLFRSFVQDAKEFQELSLKGLNAKDLIF